MVKSVKQNKKSYERPIISSFWAKVILALFVLFLYGKTIGYEFVLDDGLIIENNPVVQQGITGIGLTFKQGSVTHFKGGNFQIYRPALISLLCIENQLFGMSPTGYHLINLLLYILLVILVFELLALLFPSLHLYYRLLIALLFLAHPIHSEVVANVKSQDELLATLGCLFSLFCLVKADDLGSGKFKYLVFSLLSYLLALFSKETSFAFIVILPLALFLIMRVGIFDSIKKVSYHILAAVFFIICRYFAIRDINLPFETSAMENVLYAAKSNSELIGTKLMIAFYYLKMMVFPYPMSWDYSFNQVPVMNVTDMLPLLSIGLYALITFLFFWNIKKRPEISFGLGFFIALSVPTASIFFPNGATFADRFLFMPSLGFLIALVYLIVTWLGGSLDLISSKAKWGVNVLGVFILVLYSAITLGRTSDWKDNYSVFKSGAENSPNSSRTTEGMGTHYMNLAQESTEANERALYVDSSIKLLEKSLKIFPGNNSASYRLGLINSMLGNKAAAAMYYRKSIASKPDYLSALINLGTLYASSSNFDSAYYYFDKAVKSDPLNDMALTNISIVSYNLGKNDIAISYGEKAVAAGLGNAKIYNILSQAYLKLGDLDKSNRYKNLFDANPNTGPRLE